MASQRLSGASRRRQIADVALRIIGCRGIGHLTAAELGREVGIADATVFRHFASMDAVALAAVDRLEELIFEGFPPTDPDPLVRLKSFFLGRLEMVRERPELVQFAFCERLAEAAGSEGIERLVRIMKRTGSFVGDCLREAQRQGQIGAGLDIDALVVCVSGTLHSSAFLQYQHRNAATTTLPERAWAVVETLLRASASSAALPPAQKSNG